MCTLCPHRCRLSPGDRSVCRSRVNLDGTLYSLSYGNACSANVDPIEKKPLFHFLPATRCFFHCGRRVQFPLPQLPELGNLPGPA
jgi:pyruvate formate lyase activating enzyme